MLTSGNYDDAIDNAISSLKAIRIKRQTRLYLFIGRAFAKQEI
jgi:hypothetical protein